MDFGTGRTAPLRWERANELPVGSCRMSIGIVAVRPERVGEVAASDIGAEGLDGWLASLNDRAAWRADEDIEHRMAAGMNHDRALYAAYWDASFARRKAFLAFDRSPWSWRYEVRAMSKEAKP